MRRILLAVAMLALLFPATGLAEAKAGPSITVAAKQPQEARVLFKVLQRRRMGLTVAGVSQVLQDMKAAGELEQYRTVGNGGVISVDCSSLSVAVAGRLAGENPEAWQDIDWDEVLAFLEKLLELIIKFLPLILALFA